MTNLPRFDAPQAKPKSTGEQNWLQDLSSETAQSDFSEDFGAPDTPEADVAPEETVDPVIAAKEAENGALDALNVSLTDVISQLGREAQEQAIANVQAIAAQLFPKLAERFLADELADHLPRLIPKLAPEVEIAVPAGLAIRLQAALARTNALPSNCRFVDAGKGQPENAIRIIWPDGGYDFDFNALLLDCMAHINARNKVVEE